MLRHRDRRALIAGATLIAAAVFVSFAVLPAVRGFAALRYALHSERALLERERGVIARAADTDLALRAAESSLSELAFVALDASEPALATRELARYVEAIASASRITVRSDPLGVESWADGVSRVRVRVSGAAPYSNLMLLVHRIESAPQRLRVEQIAIRSGEASGRDNPETGLQFTIAVGGLAFEDRARLAPPGIAAANRSRGEVPSETDILASLTGDPFQPRIAENDLAGVEPAEPVTTVRAEITLVGTVALPGDEGLAMARWGTEPLRIIRVGQRIGGVRLRRVDPGAAEFEDDKGSRIVVRVPKPGA